MSKRTALSTASNLTGPNSHNGARQWAVPLLVAVLSVTMAVSVAIRYATMHSTGARVLPAMMAMMVGRKMSKERRPSAFRARHSLALVLSAGDELFYTIVSTLNVVQW